MKIGIRDEGADDIGVIRRVTAAAFALNEHSRGTEGAIIDALRAAHALTISLVAMSGGELVGHIAFSPVTIDGEQVGWYGLGPVSVRPDFHGRGIGSALIREGLSRLRRAGAQGCVLVGAPEYYRRFCFGNDSALRFAGAPAEYFMSLSFIGATPCGNVDFHEGFSAGA